MLFFKQIKHYSMHDFQKAIACIKNDLKSKSNSSNFNQKQIHLHVSRCRQNLRNGVALRRFRHLDN